MLKERKIYLYLKTEIINDIVDFFLVFEEYKVSKISDSYLEIKSYDEFYNEVLTSAREFSLVELYSDFTAFVAPLDFDFNIEDILKVIPDLNPGIYNIENLIQEIVFLNNKGLVKKLKNYYYLKFNSETIETILGFIDQNLNATKTSKELYMHRNTLNYRLDNFIMKTEIDIRSFYGALAIYLIFRR